MLSENARRHAALRLEGNYDPAIGNPSDATRVPYTLDGITRYIPATMADDPRLITARNEHDFNVLRFRHDFEFWAYTCVTITDKMTATDIHFRLNRPQRRLVAEIEKQRRAGRPLRLIMLKARQWGGSTLVQVYFAWLQIIHCRNWNSLICAHVKDTSATIRGMYSKLLARYPEEYWEEETPPEFRPFERMNNTRYIPGRGCKVTICSSENQESTRGLDCALAHLSEVAFWKDSTLHNPFDLIRSVTSGIARKPLSFIAMESTANGVGNFFHREWLRACAGESDKTPFFVPWHEIDIYTEEVTDADELWSSLDDYERDLWYRHGKQPAGVKPEVVAQWRGHLDHDLLAWKAAAMGRYYNDALLVVESNTWESSSEGHGAYILDTLADSYPNLYSREGGAPGFHTNRSTKPAVIANLIALVRDGGYIEHDNDACDELLQYEQLADGGFAARRGCHDDILMTRAIALYVNLTYSAPAPYYVTPEEFAALQRMHW